MTLKECAERGITRVTLIKDGLPIWNKYSFGDLHVYDDGTFGPWMKIYDPCGQGTLGNHIWKPITVLTVEVPGHMCVSKSDRFVEYTEPADMSRFPDCPVKPVIQPR